MSDTMKVSEIMEIIEKTLDKEFTKRVKPYAICGGAIVSICLSFFWYINTIQSGTNVQLSKSIDKLNLTLENFSNNQHNIITKIKVHETILNQHEKEIEGLKENEKNK